MHAVRTDEPNVVRSVIPVEEWDELLQAVRQSGVLGKSKRQLDLLIFLINKTVQNAAREISENEIAVTVLGRPLDFDCQCDSIVRVEMHRLRQKLELFSLKSKQYEIQIPRATYKVSAYLVRQFNHNFGGITKLKYRYG